MGVDHDANFGIGYEITGFPNGCLETEDEEEAISIEEFLDDCLKGTSYRYAEWGDGSYTGDDNNFAIVLDKPDPTGNNTYLLENLRKFLDEKGFTYNADCYVVGGVHTW